MFIPVVTVLDQESKDPYIDFMDIKFTYMFSFVLTCHLSSFPPTSCLSLSHLSPHNLGLSLSLSLSLSVSFFLFYEVCICIKRDFVVPRHQFA